jgi:hypothetical protein
MPAEYEYSFVHELITGILAGVMTVLGFFGMRLIKQVDGHDEKVVKIQKDLDEHKLESFKTFAANKDVKESFERLHDRLDVVSEDIKSLLGRH